MVEQPSVLIVEDEQITAMELEQMLEDAGYRTSALCSRGQDALDHVNENAVDLVLMDIRLSGSLDGIEAARSLQSEHGIPIVYLTASSDDETLQRARETDPEDYLIKPITEEDLRSTLTTALP